VSPNQRAVEREQGAPVWALGRRVSRGVQWRRDRQRPSLAGPRTGPAGDEWQRTVQRQWDVLQQRVPVRISPTADFDVATIVYGAYLVTKSSGTLPQKSNSRQSRHQIQLPSVGGARGSKYTVQYLCCTVLNTEYRQNTQHYRRPTPKDPRFPPPPAAAVLAGAPSQASGN